MREKQYSAVTSNIKVLIELVGLEAKIKKLENFPILSKLKLIMSF